MDGDADLGRKRKNSFLNALSSPFNPTSDNGDDDDDDYDITELSLAFRPSRQQRLPPQDPFPLDLYSLSSQPHPQQPQAPVHEVDPVPSMARPSEPQVVEAIAAEEAGGRGQRRVANEEAQQDDGMIVPPYPWATDRRATVHSYETLVSRRIVSIKGTVMCKKCNRSFEIEYDLRKRFVEIGGFIVDNKESMRDRAPKAWLSPVLPRCGVCNRENSVSPVFPQDKDGINWLFLLLGQMIGCCNLDQLRYFCEHTRNHRTGAKNRMVYYTYLALFKQLDPTGPFDP